jgi:hypothetical protein
LFRHSNGFDRTISIHDPQDDLAIEGMLGEFVAGIREARAWKVSLEDTVAALNTLKEVPDA